MKKFWNYIVKSSADPQATSATVKFALLAVIPYLMQTLNLVCTLGYQCYDIDTSLIETIFIGLSNFVYLALSIVSVVGTIFGASRKIYRTIIGENLSLIDDNTGV